MKTLMIITLVSGLNVQPAEFTDMKSCMDYAPKVEAQANVKDVTCLPFTPEQSFESKFEGMFNMFINLIEQIEQMKLEEREIDMMERDHEEWNTSKCRALKSGWLPMLDSGRLCGDVDEHNRSGVFGNP